MGRAPVLHFTRPSRACCTALWVWSVKLHKLCVLFASSIFGSRSFLMSVILLGYMLSQSKWVAVLIIVLQVIFINVRKWKQKANMFPTINNTQECLAWSPELEVTYLLLQCWRTFYKCPCLDRALDKLQSKKIVIYRSVINLFLCFYYDSIMNYECSSHHKFGLCAEDSGKAES